MKVRVVFFLLNILRFPDVVISFLFENVKRVWVGVIKILIVDVLKILIGGLDDYITNFMNRVFFTRNRYRIFWSRCAVFIYILLT